MNMDNIAPVGGDDIPDAAPEPVVPQPAPAEPEPAPEPAPAQDEEPEPVQDEDDGEERRDEDETDHEEYVPKAVAARLRRQRREAEERAEAAEKLFDRLLKQAKGETPAPPPSTQGEEAPPDPQENPEGYIVHILKQAQSAAQRVEQWERQQAQELERQRAFEREVKTASLEYKAFAEERPDFPDAYNFIKDELTKEYGAKLVFDDSSHRWRKLSQDEINRQIASDEWNFRQLAKQQGFDVAPALYEHAVARGYQSRKAVKQLQEGDARREQAERGARGMTAGSAATGGKPTYEWVIENIDSPDPRIQKRAEEHWADLDNLPRAKK